MRNLKFSLRMIGILALFFTTMQVNALTYYSRDATFSFAAAGNNWSLDRTGGTLVNYPGTSHTYIIQNGHNVTLGANQTAVALTIESGGALILNGTRTLTSPLTINSGGTLTITTRRLTMARNLTNNGTITITTGRLIRNTYTLTNSGSITMGAGQFTATSGAFTNTGTLTVTGTATITLGTGNFTNNNTSASVNFGTSNVTVSGTANQSIGGFTTTRRFTASKTAGTTTLTGDINSNGITKSGAGVLDMGSGTHTTTGTVILTAGTMNGGSSTINVNITSTTAWQGTGTVFTPGTSTVNFGSAGAQTLSATGTKTFYNLTLSNAGTKTLGTTTVNNILSLEGTAIPNVAPTYGVSSTLQYNRISARVAGAEWVSPFTGNGGVIIANTGAITTNGNKVFNINVPLTINASSTLAPAAGHAFSFGGDFINNGTWSPSTGDVTIALTKANQNIGALTTTGIVYVIKTAGEAIFTGNINGGGLTLNATGGTLSLGSGLEHVITGDLAGSGGTLNGNTSTIRIGAAVPAAITFIANTGTVDYNGSIAQTLPAVTYYNLQTSTANTKSLGGNTTVQGVFTNNTGATFSPGSSVMTLSGAGTPFVNNGTFVAGTSTISFTNAGSVNILALDYYNLNGVGGPRVLAGTGTIGIANTFTPGAGPYTVTGSTVSFNGSGAQTIPTFTFNDVILTNAGDKSIDTPVSLKNITIETGPVLNLNSTGGGALNLYIW